MKITARTCVEEALVRIEEIQQHIKNVESAHWYLGKRHPDGFGIATGKVRSLLIEEELEEWRNVFMWAITLSNEEQERIKAAAYDRFLARTSVAHWLNNGIMPSSWLASDEEEFREMARKSFLNGTKGEE